MFGEFLSTPLKYIKTAYVRYMYLYEYIQLVLFMSS